MLAKDCLEEFKVECELRRLSPRTTKGYYNNTALFLSYLEKREKLTQLEAIRPPHIKKYVQYLIGKDLSPSYVNGILKYLRPFSNLLTLRNTSSPAPPQEEYVPPNVKILLTTVKFVKVSTF